MRTRIILFQILIVQSFSLYSQEFVWANNVSGDGFEYGIEAIKDPLGNTYIIGYSTGNPFEFNGITYPTSGRSDAFFAKLDTNKDLVWMKTVGGNDPTYFDEAVDIHIDTFGDIYLTFISKGSNFRYDGQVLSDINSPGQYGGEGVLIKVTSNGEYIWHDSGTVASVFHAISTDSNGNLYLTGSFDSSITLGGTITLTNPSTGTTKDMLVAKYQPDGTILWAKNAGGMPHNTFAYGFDLEVNIQSSELIVLGFSDGDVFYDGVPTPVNNSADEGAVLISYNLDGNQNWVKAILEQPNNFSSYGISLDISNSGVIGVCGYKNFGPGLVGFYSSDGTVITEHAYPSSEAVRIFSIAFNEMNEAYLSGWCNTDAILGMSPGTVSLSTTTGFIVKIDTAQQVQWVSECTATGVHNRVNYYDESIMYAGRIDDDFIYNSGQNVIIPNNGDAIFAELVDNFLSIDTFLKEEIIVYPNPTSGLLVIASDTLQQVEIYNISGILIETTRKKEIDLSQYSKGVYLVKLSTNEGTTIKKIVLN